jgi:SAM-dependent methyltransferase
MMDQPQFRRDFERLLAMSGEQRSPDRLAAHYILEVELANRLKASTYSERAQVYTAVYESLFANLPDHPQHAARENLRKERLLQQAAFLKPYLKANSVYVELGCGDAALTKLIAPTVRSAIGVDVTPVLVGEAAPPGFSFVRTDGTELAIPSGTVNLVYSNQLLEHLHPDDVDRHLKEILRILAPGGQYICTTPNRLTGPHDISRYFSYEPQGFHLREYTYTLLNETFRAAGFRSTTPVFFLKGRAYAPPMALVAAVEQCVMRLPKGPRAALTSRARVINLAGATVIGTK